MKSIKEIREALNNQGFITACIGLNNYKVYQASKKDPSSGLMIYLGEFTKDGLHNLAYSDLPLADYVDIAISAEL